MDYIQDAPLAIDKIKNWINEGKLIYREDIEEGLENAPTTLLRLFSGKNRGKQLFINLKINNQTISQSTRSVYHVSSRKN